MNSENQKAGFSENLNPSGREFKQLDEELLIKKTFEADAKQGCQILFQKYYPLLCSHAVRLVYSKEIAEDLVSDLFCKFWTDKIYLNITTSYRAYLFKAIRFSSYNYIKWELNKNVKVDEWDAHLDISNTFKPEEILIFDELGSQIAQLVEELPTQCKRVFILSRYEGKKYKEIADELGISNKAVEAHVSRALLALRKGLKSCGMLLILLSGSIFHFT